MRKSCWSSVALSKNESGIRSPHRSLTSESTADAGTAVARSALCRPKEHGSLRGVQRSQGPPPLWGLQCTLTREHCLQDLTRLPRFLSARSRPSRWAQRLACRFAASTRENRAEQNGHSRLSVVGASIESRSFVCSQYQDFYSAPHPAQSENRGASE